MAGGMACPPISTPCPRSPPARAMSSWQAAARRCWRQAGRRKARATTAGRQNCSTIWSLPSRTMLLPRPRSPTATRRWALPPNRASGAITISRAPRRCAAPNCRARARAPRAAASSAPSPRRSSSMRSPPVLPPNGQATCAPGSTSSCPIPRRPWASWSMAMSRSRVMARRSAMPTPQ